MDCSQLLIFCHKLLSEIKTCIFSGLLGICILVPVAFSVSMYLTLPLFLSQSLSDNIFINGTSIFPGALTQNIRHPCFPSYFLSNIQSSFMSWWFYFCLITKHILVLSCFWAFLYSNNDSLYLLNSYSHFKTLITCIFLNVSSLI